MLGAVHRSSHISPQAARDAAIGATPKPAARAAGRAGSRRCQAAYGSAEHNGAGPTLNSVLSETKRNLDEINSKRLRLVEELAAAQKRIQQLEGELNQLKNDASRSSPEASQALSGNAVAANTIRLSFPCNWPECFMHYQVEGAAWTQTPGIKLQRATWAQGQPYMIDVPGQRVTCCFNDGKGRWDSRGGQNYVIDAPGSYVIRNSRVERQ